MARKKSTKDDKKSTKGDGKKSIKEGNEKSNSYILIRDNKSSALNIIKRTELSYRKTDNLKAGTSAKYNGAGVRSNAFEGTVIMGGSKDQCKSNISLIEKANKNNNDDDDEKELDDDEKELDDSTSSSNNPLIIDEQRVEIGDLRNNGVSVLDHDSSKMYSLAREEHFDATTASENVTISPVTNSTSAAPSSPLPSATRSQNTILEEKNTNTGISNKRKENLDESSSSTKRKRRAKVSHSDYEKLKQENKRLTKQLDLYKENWMPRPSPAAATYFIEVGKILYGHSNNENDSEEEGDGEQLQRIMTVLNLSEKELRKLEHESDITKTCRHIIKHLYEDPKKRAKMLVSSLDPNVLKSIQDYARLAHPALSRISNSALNNAIGNVFATDKRQQGGNDTDSDSSDDVEENEEDDTDADD